MKPNIILYFWFKVHPAFLYPLSIYQFSTYQTYLFKRMGYRLRFERFKPLLTDKIFSPVQIQSICRRRKNSDSRIEIYIGKSRKHCEGRRKYWLPAFSPVLTMFSKAVFSRGVKSRDCVVKR